MQEAPPTLVTKISREAALGCLRKLDNHEPAVEQPSSSVPPGVLFHVSPWVRASTSLNNRVWLGSVSQRAPLPAAFGHIVYHSNRKKIRTIVLSEQNYVFFKKMRGIEDYCAKKVRFKHWNFVYIHIYFSHTYTWSSYMYVYIGETWSIKENSWKGDIKWYSRGEHQQSTMAPMCGCAISY